MTLGPTDWMAALIPDTLRTLWVHLTPSWWHGPSPRLPFSEHTVNLQVPSSLHVAPSFVSPLYHAMHGHGCYKVLNNKIHGLHRTWDVSRSINGFGLTYLAASTVRCSKSNLLAYLNCCHFWRVIVSPIIMMPLMHHLRAYHRWLSTLDLYFLAMYMTSRYHNVSSDGPGNELDQPVR